MKCPLSLRCFLRPWLAVSLDQLFYQSTAFTRHAYNNAGQSLGLNVMSLPLIKYPTISIQGTRTSLANNECKEFKHLFAVKIKRNLPSLLLAPYQLKLGNTAFLAFLLPAAELQHTPAVEPRNRHHKIILVSWNGYGVNIQGVSKNCLTFH